MDTPLSDLLPALAQPMGVAALFALAIWAGVRIASQIISAARDVEMARIGIQQTLAEALRVSATAVGEQAAAVRELRTQVGALEIVCQRLFLLNDRDRGTASNG